MPKGLYSRQKVTRTPSDGNDDRQILQIKGQIAIFAGMGTARLVRRLATALLILTALLGVVSIARAERSSPAQPRIPLGARLALADLDGDNLADKAELGATGLSKNIQLRLSRTGQFSVLTFDTASLDRGSLLAQDVNDDGEVDLIWTDLVHPDAVIVWLNNGRGRFERACPGEYGDRFTISGFSIDRPFTRCSETGIGFGRVFLGDLLISEKTWQDQPPRRSGCLGSARVSVSTTLAGPPAGRAPPSV